MKERSTRTSATREMDSGERLEDNAIIRNYRVRPRLAELSHSVSITGRASLGLSLRFILPLNYPFSLFRFMLPGARTCIHAVYTYTFMYKCHHTPSKHRREKLIDFERRRHANLAQDNAVKSIEFAHRSVNERRNSESSRLPASHAILLFGGLPAKYPRVTPLSFGSIAAIRSNDPAERKPLSCEALCVTLSFA